MTIEDNLIIHSTILHKLFVIKDFNCIMIKLIDLVLSLSLNVDFQYAYYDFFHLYLIKSRINKNFIIEAFQM